MLCGHRAQGKELVLSNSRQLAAGASHRERSNQAKGSIYEELRHRGEPLVVYPAAELWQAVGGSGGVAALIKDLYRRIEQDELLRGAFSHFNSEAATPFFVEWFGGSREYSDDLTGGLLRRHQHRYISPKAAAAWLRCMREALVARGLEAEPIMRPLARIAKAMIHSPETDPKELCKSCDAVQDTVQVHFEKLLDAAANGRTENVRKALENDRTLASGAGCTTARWPGPRRTATAQDSRADAEAGADCNSPACDPMRATMACDDVQMGTGVAVTPLAIAKKWQPALSAAGGARRDRRRVHGSVAGRPAGAARSCRSQSGTRQRDRSCRRLPGSLAALPRGLRWQYRRRAAASRSWRHVKRHSGKLLTLAVVMNRVDLVKLLIEHGAEVERTGFLGRLDDVERPVADLLIANGKKVPDWMLPRACRPDVSTNELHRVTVLLDYGASVDDRGRYGLTALHYAVRGGKLPLIKLLLERGGKVNALDKDGLTPLLHLSKTRSKADPIPVLKLLVANGANVDGRDETQGTLLMYFARHGKAEPVHWLLRMAPTATLATKAGRRRRRSDASTWGSCDCLRNNAQVLSRQRLGDITREEPCAVPTTRHSTDKRHTSTR